MLRSVTMYQRCKQQISHPFVRFLGRVFKQDKKHIKKWITLCNVYIALYDIHCLCPLKIYCLVYLPQGNYKRKIKTMQA